MVIDLILNMLKVIETQIQEWTKWRRKKGTNKVIYIFIIVGVTSLAKQM